MTKNFTLKNFEIQSLIAKFWQQAALVCCMLFVFGVLTSIAQTQPCNVTPNAGNDVTICKNANASEG